MLLLYTVAPLITFPKFDAGIWLILAMIVVVFIISYLAIRQPEIFQPSVQEKGVSIGANLVFALNSLTAC